MMKRRMDRLNHINNLIDEVVDERFKRYGRDVREIAKLRLTLAIGHIALLYCVENDECYYTLVETLSKHRILYEEKSNHWGE